MQFRDLKKQYEVLKPDIDQAIQEVLAKSNFISGEQVSGLFENKRLTGRFF